MTLRIIKEVPVDLIDASRFQCRTHFSGIEELAMTIKEQGLHQPVTVREMANGRFELVFGERRLRACKHLGLDTVTAFVRDMTDEEAAIASATENLERKDLHPLEEAQSIQMLLDSHWTMKQVADKLGRSVQWTARRAQLTKLNEAWRMMLCRENQGVSRWSGLHLEFIARFPDDVQTELAKRFDTGKHSYRFGDVAMMTLADLRGAIANSCHALSAAPWKQADAMLLPEVGACIECSKRTDVQPELFDADEFGAEKKDKGVVPRCLDILCWERKLTAALKAKEAALRAENKETVLLREHYNDDGPFKGKTVREHDEVRRCKKSDPGAMPALIVDGKSAGQTTWVTKQDYGHSSPRLNGAKGIVKTLKERRKEYGVRRLRWIVNQVVDKLDMIGNGKTDVLAYKPVEIIDKLALVCAFGTRDRAQYYQLAWQAEARKIYSDTQKETEECAVNTLYRSAVLVLADNVKYAGQSQEPNAGKIKWTCDVIGLDHADLSRQAEEAIPYPKSWANLNEDGTPKKAAANTGKAKAKKSPEVTTKGTKKKVKSAIEHMKEGMRIEEEGAADLERRAIEADKSPDVNADPDHPVIASLAIPVHPRNKSGVFLPEFCEKIVVPMNDPKTHVTLFVAQDSNTGMWHEGYEALIDGVTTGCGGCQGAPSTLRPGWDSREYAISSAVSFVCKWCNAYKNNHSHAIKRAICEWIEEFDLKENNDAGASATVSYVDKKGRVLFVHGGLGVESWGTYWRGKSGGLHRVVSNKLPVRETRNEAQRDLDAYAAKHGLEASRSEINQGSAA